MTSTIECTRHTHQTSASCQTSVVAIIPAYNEERFIGSMVLKARRYVDQVIVIDDGSQDETAALARAAGALVIQHAENQGKGAALNTGFRKAATLSPDVVVTIDADGQHLPMEIWQVVEPVVNGQADVVIGSRYMQKRCAVPGHRVWGHRVFNLLTTITSGVTSTDSQSGFRAFSPRAVECFAFRSNGFAVESEMQFLVGEHKLKLVEVPITIRYQDKAKRNVFQHGLMVLNGVLRLTGQYRPLLFFGLPGFIVLLAGLLMGIWVVDIYQRAQTLAVGYALISVMLFIAGLVAFSTGVTLHSIRGLLQDNLRAHEQIQLTDE